jgi:hypothetical protein
MTEHSNIQPHKRNIANEVNFVRAMCTVRFSQILGQLKSGCFDVLNFILPLLNIINKLQPTTFMIVFISLHTIFFIFSSIRAVGWYTTECYLHLNIYDTVSVPLCLFCKHSPSRPFKPNVNSDSTPGIEPSCTLLSIFPQPVSNLSGRNCDVLATSNCLGAERTFYVRLCWIRNPWN